MAQMPSMLPAAMCTGDLRLLQRQLQALSRMSAPSLFLWFRTHNVLYAASCSSHITFLHLERMRKER